PVSREDLSTIEARVNDLILEDRPVRWYVTNKEQAMKEGATALFGEKYGDRVRVVCVSGLNSTQPELAAECVSRELCGGTHVAATGQIGPCFIVSESSVASGVRRIEAVTGRGARAYVRGRLGLLDGLTAVLESTPDRAGARLETLLAERDALKKEVAAMQ